MQGRWLPKWLIVAVASVTQMTSPITLVWRGGSLDLTDAPAFAQDGNSSGSG